MPHYKKIIVAMFVIVFAFVSFPPKSIFADEIGANIHASSFSESHASSGDSSSNNSSESHVFVTASSSDDGHSSLDISTENKVFGNASSSGSHASSESSSGVHIHIGGNDEPTNHENQNNIGSITFCKIIVDQSGNINNGLARVGNFSFPEVSVPHGAGVFPATHFATPLVLSADLIGHDGVNDAECITYRNLHLGSYFYAQENIDGSGWAEPLYNDQYTVPLVTLADFFPYSGHFSSNDDESYEDDTSTEHWNKNSDGHIVLSSNRPDRTLVVLNRFLENTPPLPKFACSDTVDNDGDGKIDAADSTCHSDGNPNNPDSYTPSKDTENSAPVITLIGNATTTITVGDTFTDPGATAQDAEDGDITSNIHATSTVNAAVAGTYTIVYGVKDSKGLSAEEKMRTVVVLLTGVCVEPVDVMLVLDRSESMTENGNPALADAKQAAKAFIDKLHSTDRVGLALFAGGGVLSMPLTNDFGGLKNTVDAVTVARGGTNIGDGIDVAHREMTLHGRPNVKKVIIILSDGYTNHPLRISLTPRDYAISKAAATKSDGITIYSVGLGNEVDEDLMRRIASTLNFYFFSPTSDKLQEIYLSIAKIECVRKPASIDGTVINDTNKNGVRDAGETGLGNWTVTLKDINGVLSDRIATTTEQGEYIFNDVILGTYNLCSAPLSGWTQTIPATATSCHGNLAVASDSRTNRIFGFFASATNTPPVITILGNNPLHLFVGDMFDPFNHATTTDPDGDSVILHASSTVSTTTPGTYRVDYTAEDSHGLFAEPKTLIVAVEEAPLCRLPEFTSALNIHTMVGTAFSYTFTATSTETTAPVFTVAASSLPAGLSFSLNAITGTTTTAGTFTIAVSAANMCGISTSTLSIIVDQNGGGGGGGHTSACSDTVDNDGDGKIDAADSTCHSDGNPNNPDSYTPSKDTENSAPVITLIGNATTTITVGDTFTDPGATAQDAEDGDITSNIHATSTVNAAVAGTYTIVYGVKDSKGLSAEEKTRTVTIVNPSGGGGSTTFGGGGGGVVLLPSGKKLPPPPHECYYLREFIKFGADNNPEEVKKLQAFLNSFEDANLLITGFYDVPTLNAVNAFQKKYSVDILDPWGHEAPTGYVYLTTRKKVNEAYCRAAFPLDENQTKEIVAFKKLLESLKLQGIIPPEIIAVPTNIGATNENGEGIVLGTTTPIITREELGLGKETISAENNDVTPTPVTERSAFRNMLGAAYGAVMNTISSFWLVLLLAAFLAVAIVLVKRLYREENMPVSSDVVQPEELTE